METKTDSYGSYTPSPPCPIVPVFPCSNQDCTSENRICLVHSNVLFVQVLRPKCDGEVGMEVSRRVEIPFGKWEDWEWYYARVSDAIAKPVDEFSLVFAGCRRSMYESRHSGLQRQSTIHCILRK